MPKICYVEKKFGADRLSTIKQVNQIIVEYKEQGFELTLRQLYYQFVARGLIENKFREYKNLGDVVNDGRLAGLIDWDAIVDRTRNLQTVGHWESPASIIESCALAYHIDRWKTQAYRPEVWIEKDALIGVIEGVCTRNDVPYFSCRGYTSQSELWAAGMRLAKYGENGQTPIVFHLGDHDPSGIDMTRDIEERLKMFAGVEVEVRRLALNMPQVKKYNPPPNPCKLTDSRADGYVATHGGQSWELDALDPKVIDNLIQTEIRSIRDEKEWEEAFEKESDEKLQLQNLSDRWTKITKYLK